MKMSFNFADPGLYPHIKASAVAVDGYEVTNLISPQPNNRARGYLVESFIKPPVSVTIQFPVNIELESIVLSTAIRSHRSCGVEVYSNSQKRETTWLFDKPKITGYIESKEEIDAKQRVYSCVGRAQDTESKCFKFTNYSFHKHDTYRTLPAMPRRLVSGSIREAEMRSKFRNNLNNVSHVMVRLTRAIHGSTCALNWIEIWGQPAWSTPKPWISQLLLLMKQQHAAQSAANFYQNTSSTAASSESDTLLDFSELPEEFVDPITVELLTMPVLLPSGKTVNQSTLDRHIEEQAKWGQPGSDPYTGKVFTDQEKPVPNPSLKARIDKYLFQNPCAAKKHDFRVGRASTVPRSAMPVTQSCLTSISHSRCKSHELNTVPVRTNSSYYKRHLEDPNEDNSKYLPPHKLCKISSEEKNGNAFGKVSTVCNVSQSNSNYKSRTSTSTQCSSDLESTLKATLAGLPSFINIRKTQPDQSHQICMLCKKAEDISIQYRLACSHLICKVCLLTETSRQKMVACRTCQYVSTKADIVKAHL